MKYEVGDFIVTLCDGVGYNKNSIGIILYNIGNGIFMIKILANNHKGYIHEHNLEHDKIVGTKLWEALS